MAKGRPKSPASTKAGHSESKEQLKARAAMEESLKGDTNLLEVVPDGMCEDAQLYYKFLVHELTICDLLSNLDVPILKLTANCLARLDKVEERLLQDGDFIEVPDRNGLMVLKEHPAIKTQNTLSSQFRAYCGQLGLSPSARASLAGLKMEAKAEETDPVVKALRGEVDY